MQLDEGPTSSVAIIGGIPCKKITAITNEQLKDGLENVYVTNYTCNMYKKHLPNFRL